EAALLAAVAGGLPVPADAESLDPPRPLPEPLRARLESALLAEAAAAAASPTAAEGGASPSAPAAAATGASPSAPAGDVVQLASRRRKVVAVWSSVAAVLLLVVAVAGLAGRGGNPGSGSLEAAGGPTSTTLEKPAPLPSGAGDSSDVTSPAPTAPVSPTTRATRPRPSPSTTAPKTPGAGGDQGGPAPTSPTVPASPEPSGGAPAPGATDQDTPPPFYNSPPPGEGAAPAMTSGPPAAASPSGGSGSQDAAPSNQTQKSATPAPAGSRLRVGIIPGDAAQEAGFRAYINRLNQSGGVSGHGIDLVTVGPGAPAANTIATVNLSSQPVAGPGGAPGWATGPLLETLTATADLLPGNGAVFSFASPPERQGHLAADALFPAEASAGTHAVIYVPVAAGPFRDAVPAAIEAVLKLRKVTVQVVTYDPAAHKPLTPADAAFVSLDPADAKAWVAQAKAEGYRPAAGVAGIYSLADEALLPDLPEGTRVVSPYVVPGGDEGQAIRSEGRGTSAPVLHGWATAKSLAAALWRTGADTPAEVQTALEGLTGWSSGLAPPYETRSGTRSRTPEGVVFQEQSGAFIARGGFRRDPY
ncbi:MAG TPA: hypothetical protein VG034_21670, partial [Acidimicrobiia bacterium]|nr:hypothetical protein [Acidimicrobiia bacterium]